VPGSGGRLRRGGELHGHERGVSSGRVQASYDGLSSRGRAV
jgi:hypothetical protein